MAAERKEMSSYLERTKLEDQAVLSESLSDPAEFCHCSPLHPLHLKLNMAELSYGNISPSENEKKKKNSNCKGLLMLLSNGSPVQESPMLQNIQIEMHWVEHISWSENEYGIVN